jgi:endonuclease/exonuclease/phosphatase family metal-dependent hydrolase
MSTSTSALPVTISSPTKSRLVVGTYNTNFDSRALIGPFSWDSRKDSVVLILTTINADIWCLQELRDDAVRYLMASPILTKTYDMVVSRTNATDMSLCLLTMWNKKKLSCNLSTTEWFGQCHNGYTECWQPAPGGNGFGRVMLITRFVPAAYPNPKSGIVDYGVTFPSNITGFTVINNHFGLPQLERMYEAAVLHCCAEIHARLGEAVVMCGDFNSFDDMGGKEQVISITKGASSLSNLTFHEAGEWTPLLPTISKTTIGGTQIPYPYDTFVKFKGTDHEEIHPIEGEIGGKLDHIFYSAKLHTPVDTWLMTYRMDGSVALPEDLAFHKADTAPRFPSDHIPLVTAFELGISEDRCIICSSDHATYAAVPCGDLYCCSHCMETTGGLTKCPICKREITSHTKLS